MQHNYFPRYKSREIYTTCLVNLPVDRRCASNTKGWLLMSDVLAIHIACTAVCRSSPCHATCHIFLLGSYLLPCRPGHGLCSLGLLDTFVKLWKASSFPSTCPSFCVPAWNDLVPTGRIFHEIWYVRIFSKMLWENSSFNKIWQE